MKMIRPYIHINVAMTADGKTDTIERRGSAISSSQDKTRVDQLRAASDAVMVGGRTLLGDDPKLTVKSVDLRAERVQRNLPPNPAKVGIVSLADLKPDSNFLSAGPARTILFTTSQTSQPQIAMLRAHGAVVYVHEGQRVDLAAALHTLKDDGIERLMVEGGGTLIFELLRLGLADQLTVYIAPMIFGGESAPTMAAGLGFVRNAAIPLKLAGVEAGEDGGVMLNYQIS